MTFSTRNFDPLTPVSPKVPKFCYTNIAFSLETHCGRRHTYTCATKFLHHLGTGCCLQKEGHPEILGFWGVCQKQRLWPKLEGAGLRQHPKIRDPLCISATVEASNFKFGTQIGFGLVYQKKQRFGPNWRGCGPVEHPKKLGPPTYFCNR